MEIKVYYEDTDCGGVVYYANYLRYFERARTEFLADRKISLAAYQKKGITFTVVSASINYKFPAVYGDELEINTLVEGVKGSSFVAHYTIRRKADEKLLVTGSTRMACVSKDIKPIRMPEEIHKALTSSFPKRRI